MACGQAAYLEPMVTCVGFILTAMLYICWAVHRSPGMVFKPSWMFAMDAV